MLIEIKHGVPVCTCYRKEEKQKKVMCRLTVGANRRQFNGPDSKPNNLAVSDTREM